MAEISVVTIAKLIEAHMEKDDEKFMSYANFIASKYRENGNDRASKIIEKRLDGSYKTDSKIVLD